MDPTALTGFWQIARPLIISAIVGYIVWLLQQRQTAKRALERDAEKKKREEVESEAKSLLARIALMEQAQVITNEKLAIMDQTVVPMYKAMQAKLVEILTHPSQEFTQADALLAKVKDPTKTLTDEEMEALEVLLKERETDPSPKVTDEERLAAKMLPDVIKLEAIERETTDPIVSIQLVSSTVRRHSEKAA